MQVYYLPKECPDNGIARRGFASLAAIFRSPAQVGVFMKTTIVRTGGAGYYDSNVTFCMVAHTGQNGMGGGRAAALVAEVTAHVTGSGTLEWFHNADDYGVVIAHPGTDEETCFAGGPVLPEVRRLVESWLVQEQLKSIGVPTAGYAPLRRYVDGERLEASSFEEAARLVGVSDLHIVREANQTSLKMEQFAAELWQGSFEWINDDVIGDNYSPVSPLLVPTDVAAFVVARPEVTGLLPMQANGQFYWVAKFATINDLADFAVCFRRMV